MRRSLSVLFVLAVAVVLSAGISVSAASNKFANTSAVDSGGSFTVTFEEGGMKKYPSVDYRLDATAIARWLVSVDPPRRIEMLDGFANADGTPNQDMPGPGAMNVTIEPIGDGRTRMTIENVFPDQTAMEQLLAMGQEEGMTQAVGQIDAILAEDAVTGAAR